MPSQNDSQKACHNCIKRRIICDKSSDRCNKCAKANLTCPGYGVRYRFAKATTINSSGFAPTSSVEETELSKSKLQRKPYKWVKCSGGPTATKPRSSRAPAVRISPPGRSHSPVATIPTGLSDLDPRIQLYFLHFATYVSPITVVFDDDTNGYRHHVLPLAHSEPLVQRAVCIASAFHLSSKQPHLRAPAEVIRAGLIRKLSEASKRDPDLSEATWATIILLIVADIVTGHEDVSSLYDVLATFMDARGPLKEPATPLEKFLYFQSCLVGFFMRPFSPIESRTIGPSRDSSDPVSIFAEYAHSQQAIQNSPSYQGELAALFPVYEKAYRCAFDIYKTRMEPTILPVDPDDFMEARVQQIRTLCERLDPAAPGSHVIVWPIFVAAAESCSDKHRQYFTVLLRQLWERTGYANISRGLEVLPELWAQRGRRSWTSALSEYRGLVVC
ncbi:hypothetical protein F4677DRAFT_428078 [Hypoxylon crocopeplum]|nr:hypothetical protein F4677DRAFT_428078 [Hypoxylon crocopeplum]